MYVFKEIKFQTKYLVTLGSLGEHLSATVAEWFASHFNNKNKPIYFLSYFKKENLIFFSDVKSSLATSFHSF